MTLDKISLFSELAGEELDLLMTHAVTRTYPKNSVVLHEGDDSRALFVVMEGKVKTFLSDDKGREIVLNTHGPGEYFGELALFDNSERSASVITLEKSVLTLIPGSEFERCLYSSPGMSLRIIRGLVSRLRKSTDNVRSLALLDVYGRVARLLLQIAEEDGDELVVREKLTHQDIADRVGSSREMVSRILKDLKTGGYIETEGRCIRIKEKLPSGW